MFRLGKFIQQVSFKNDKHIYHIDRIAKVRRMWIEDVMSSSSLAGVWVAHFFVPFYSDTSLTTCTPRLLARLPQELTQEFSSSRPCTCL